MSSFSCFFVFVFVLFSFFFLLFVFTLLLLLFVFFSSFFFFSFSLCCFCVFLPFCPVNSCCPPLPVHVCMYGMYLCVCVCVCLVRFGCLYPELTFELLKVNKRFLATTGFLTESGLQQAREKVQKYCSFLRDFPVQGLIAATDWPSLGTSVKDMFAHVQSNVKRFDYPFERAVQLILTMTRGVAQQIRAVWLSNNMMSLPLQDFAVLTDQCLKRVFDEWTNAYTECREHLGVKGSAIWNQQVKGSPLIRPLSHGNS
jgi:hypothetical protein